MLRLYLYAFLACLIAAAGFLAYPSAAGGVAPQASSVVKVVLTQGHGSGVHIGNGFFLTAAHVAKGVKVVSLKTSDGKTIAANVLWVNAAYDIAFLSANGAGISSSPLACRAAAEDEPIRAAGNPLALEFVSSYGHISGKAREIGSFKSVYVTDITTVHGMSGGPTFDAAGNVIGITVGAALAPLQAGNSWTPSMTGFGFVVPSKDVCKLLGRAA